MVRRALWIAVVLAVGFAGSTCRVVNQDHCANQDIPGNEFCLEISDATPYCSPCRRDFQGCVDFEPFACPGYANEVVMDDSTTAGTMSSGAPTGTAGTATGGMAGVMATD